jgi:hypothetical protein
MIKSDENCAKSKKKTSNNEQKTGFRVENQFFEPRNKDPLWGKRTEGPLWEKRTEGLKAPFSPAKLLDVKFRLAIQNL